MALEARHRAQARVEDAIRAAKDTGLSNLPFRDFAANAAWLELVLIAQDLMSWAQALLLEGDLARAEPKRLRYRLLHVAGRITRSGRRVRCTSLRAGRGPGRSGAPSGAWARCPLRGSPPAGPARARRGPAAPRAAREPAPCRRSGGRSPTRLARASATSHATPREGSCHAAEATPDACCTIRASGPGRGTGARPAASGRTLSAHEAHNEGGLGARGLAPARAVTPAQRQGLRAASRRLAPGPPGLPKLGVGVRAPSPAPGESPRTGPPLLGHRERSAPPPAGAHDGGVGDNLILSGGVVRSGPRQLASAPGPWPSPPARHRHRVARGGAPPRRPGDRGLDLAGGCVLPGLTDTHLHILG